MAESTTSLEQRKYLQSIVGTSDTANMNPFDQSQPGLTGSGEAGTEGAQEKDLVDLPFRFTQWQLNAGNKAATGQWDRTGIARSPFQSGQLALELEGIQGQLKNLPEMNAAPTPPTLPEDPPDPSFATGASALQTARSPALGESAQETRSVRPNENMNMRYGLPLKEYQIPSNMILGSRNPIDAARAFESKYKTPEERAAFGPMITIQGYDIDALMKSSGWGGNLTEKYGGDENKATQRFFNNLAIMPSSFDPDMYSKDTKRNLSSEDFTFNKQPIVDYDEPALTWIPPSGEGEGGRWVDLRNMGEGGGAPEPTGGRLAYSDEEWDQQFKFGQTGETGTVGQTGFEDFYKRYQDKLTREFNNGNVVSRLAHKYGLQATIAMMAAMTAGAASTAMAPAAGAAGGAAGGGAGAAAPGIAGAMGMSAGAGATTVNTVASLIAKYGVTTAAQMAGVPVENPMFQLAMAAAGGAYSGATSVPTGETIDIGVAGNRNMVPTEIVNASPEVQSSYYSAVASGAPNFTYPGTNSGINYKELGNKAGQFGIKVGMNELASAGAEDLQDQAGSGESFSNTGEQGYLDQGSLNSEMEFFNRELESYNAELAAYNQKVAQYEAYKKQLEERSTEVQRLMGAYEKASGNWASRQSLIARQTGIQQQIQDSISGNKAYDPNAAGTGVQGALWR